MKLTPTETWQSVTTAKQEVWQAWGATVVVDTDATAGDRLGIQLAHGDSISFASGVTVYYRLLSGRTDGQIARVAVVP